jgi:acetate kinase
MKEIGALATCLGGLDAIAFTSGIGERAAPIRASIVRALEWFGVRLDPQANAAHARRIEASDSRVRIFVIPTDEEGIIARETVRVLKSQAG